MVQRCEQAVQACRQTLEAAVLRLYHSCTERHRKTVHCHRLPFPFGPAVLCPVMLCPAVPCPAVPCCALVCPAPLCPALPCPALSCCALPCYALLCPTLLTCELLNSKVYVIPLPSSLAVYISGQSTKQELNRTSAAGVRAKNTVMRCPG